MPSKQRYVFCGGKGGDLSLWDLKLGSIVKFYTVSEGAGDACMVHTTLLFHKTLLCFGIGHLCIVCRRSPLRISPLC